VNIACTSENSNKYCQPVVQPHAYQKSQDRRTIVLFNYYSSASQHQRMHVQGTSSRGNRTFRNSC